MSQRTGELWVPATDICQATGRPLPHLGTRRTATMCAALMAAAPLAPAYQGATASVRRLPPAQLDAAIDGDRELGHFALPEIGTAPRTEPKP